MEVGLNRVRDSEIVRRKSLGIVPGLPIKMCDFFEAAGADLPPRITWRQVAVLDVIIDAYFEGWNITMADASRIVSRGDFRVGLTVAQSMGMFFLSGKDASAPKWIKQTPDPEDGRRKFLTLTTFADVQDVGGEETCGDALAVRMVKAMQARIKLNRDMAD